jgi:hypothetical protein
MKYYFITGLILLFALIGSCKGQSVSEIKKTVDTADIIDPIETIPFSIYRQSETAELPDSLVSRGSKGFAVLNLYINEKAVVDSFEVTKLLITNNGENIINYYKSLPLSDEVKRFYPLFADYLKNEVKVRKDPKVRSGKTTTILMVRFK